MATCREPMELACVDGHPLCYNVSDICIQKLNSFGRLVPCSTGGNLASCVEFECNRNFKCPESYCVLWAKVCDGIWDCPLGEDEKFHQVCGSSTVCEHMFKCSGTKIQCIHLANVCDDVADCEFHDDEMLCSLNIPISECTRFCHCLAMAISCTNLFGWTFEKYLPFLSVFLASGKSPLDLTQVLMTFTGAISLILPSNMISSVCFVTHSSESKVKYLDMSFNNVTNLSTNCMSSFLSLKFISLEDNMIQAIETHSFTNLPQLTVLILSHNPLSHLAEKIFKNTPNFQHLEMKETQIVSIKPKTFFRVKVEQILATDFLICCIAPLNSKCFAIKPWYSSCTDLLPSKSLQILFGLISFLIVVVNVTSSSCHYKDIRTVSKDSKLHETFCVSVMFLNMTDLLCAIFLMSLWAVDLSMRGSFMLKQEVWRSSNSCFSAFFTVLWFTFLSQCVLLFIAASKLFTVLFPVNTRFKQKSFVLRILCVATVSSSLIGFAVTVLTKQIEKELPMNMCLPFVDPRGASVSISVLTWLVVSLQTFTLISLAVFHSSLVLNITKAQRKIEKAKSKTDSNTILIIQLLVLTGSNILCWVPANCVFLVAMFLASYPLEMVIWTTVLGVPFNSLVNPVFFTCIFMRNCVKVKQKPSCVNDPPTTGSYVSTRFRAEFRREAFGDSSSNVEHWGLPTATVLVPASED